MDYGSVLCSSSNSVGSQTQPCVFHIVPAGEWGSCRILYLELIAMESCRHITISGMLRGIFRRNE